MHADAFFCIGRTHTVCQDYALCGDTPNGFPYAVVSDGCSSSPDTDFGARILAKVAARRLCTGEPLTDEFLIAEAAGVARQCLLPDTALDATLMYAHSMIGRAVQVVVYGDGAVITKNNQGIIEVYGIEYAHGAPGYLTYHLDSRRKKVYLEETEEGLKSLTRVRMGRNERSDQAIMPTSESGLRPTSFFFPPEEYEYVLIASDGIMSFLKAVVTETSSAQEAVDFLDVVRGLIDIKGFKGQFLQRRCRKFFSKFCAAEGWFNADDFSLAGIYLGIG
jgi:hypothetical protein